MTEVVSRRAGDGGSEARFRTAAMAYRVYGVVYLLGGLWLVSQGVGVRGGPAASRWQDMAVWAVIGLFFLITIPYLLTTRRRWLGVIERRHIALVLSAFLAYRAWKVAGVVMGPPRSVPAPWGGEVSYATGAAIFVIITLAALVAAVRAGWRRDAA